MVTRPWSSSRLSCGERIHLTCDGNAGNSFPTTQGAYPSSRALRRKRGSSGLGRDSRASSRVEMGMLGNFLSCSKGVKDPLEVPSHFFISLFLILSSSSNHACESPPLVKSDPEHLLSLPLFLCCTECPGPAIISSRDHNNPLTGPPTLTLSISIYCHKLISFPMARAISLKHPKCITINRLYYLQSQDF